MTQKILVIGYGNQLRRDDGAGIIAVEQLQQKIKYPNCTFTTAHQLQPEMIADFAGVDVVVLVDADAKIKVGDIHSARVAPVNDEQHPVTHFMKPQRMLWICQQLYKCAPETTLFTIGGYDFGYGDGLSAIVAEYLPQLVEKISEYIKQYIEVSQSA